MNGVAKHDEKVRECSHANASAQRGEVVDVPVQAKAACPHSGSTSATHIESWFTEALCQERSAINAMLESRHRELESDFRTWLKTRTFNGLSSSASAANCTSQALLPKSPTKPLDEDQDVSSPVPDVPSNAELQTMRVASARSDADQAARQTAMYRSSCFDEAQGYGERDSRHSRASISSGFHPMMPPKKSSNDATKSNKLKAIIYNHEHDHKKSPHMMPRSKRLIALIVDQFMGLITVINIITIGISTDNGQGWIGWVFIDAFFTLCYTGEMAIKLHLLGCKTYLRGSEYAWNILEATLVFLALSELVLTIVPLVTEDSAEESSGSKISLLRVIRLTRIVRLVRVCRIEAFGELAQIIQGAMGGMRTLAWSMVMVLLPLYTVALILRETVGAYDDAKDHPGIKEFTHLGSALFTVFRCVVAGDCSSENGTPIIVLMLQEYGWGYALLYVCTLLGFNFGLVNVILAIYVENSVAASKYSQIAKKRNRLMNNKIVSEKAYEMVYMIVWYAAQVLETPVCVEYMARGYGLEDFDITDAEKVTELVTVAAGLEITHELWTYLSTDDRFSELLSELDISTEDQMDLFETFDVDGSQSLDLVELLQGVKKLRGDPHRSDVIGVSLLVRGVMDSLENMQHSVDSIYQRQEALMKNVKKSLYCPPKMSLQGRSSLSPG
eukprot:TRINITY_DN22628_c0_g2_i3.p1 TRINITY_DN22628_c0_g2~~TRINITY_DN22628_c0_g2_i3.p1  ORF type:complete len:689 (-),score=80.67 TRINITY_DN22628_c0_g2_i3:85-2097(-)